MSYFTNDSEALADLKKATFKKTKNKRGAQTLWALTIRSRVISND